MKFTAPTETDYNQIRTRTIIALDRLGHQKFPAESGGYSLENWVKGVDLLLDEFEEKIGWARLPVGYAEKRRLLMEYVLRPVDTTSIDNDISDLRQKEAELVRRLHEARARTNSRIDELQDELVRRTAEVEEAKAPVIEAKSPTRSRSFFKLIFGRTSESTEEVQQGKVLEAEERLRSLPNEIIEQQKVLKSFDQRSPDSPMAEEWRTLESLQSRIAELEGQRLEKIQLVKERQQITASFADMISKIPLSD
jgi:hypothetical protein